MILSYKYNLIHNWSSSNNNDDMSNKNNVIKGTRKYIWTKTNAITTDQLRKSNKIDNVDDEASIICTKQIINTENCMHICRCLSH